MLFNRVAEGVFLRDSGFVQLYAQEGRRKSASPLSSTLCLSSPAQEITMIFDMNNEESQALLTRWQAAKNESDLLAVEFDAAIKLGKLDQSTAKALSDRMSAAHNKAMDILGQIQNHRLDE